MKNLLLVLFFNIPFCFYAQFSEQKLIDEYDFLSPWSIYAADIDGDGNIDLLSASTSDDTLAWYKNTSMGGFGEKQIITQNLDQTRYITAADIDNDGDMDVLATTGSINLVVWYENLDGLGNFGTQQIISTDLLLPKMVIAADVDGDGDLDAIIASRADNKVTWVENTDGQGTFGTQQLITNNALAVESVFFADINGDGIKDVICDSSNNGVGNPSWFENDGDGNFGSLQEITQDTSGSQYVLADDVDGDGDMDVLNIEFGGETIAWYENTDGQGDFGPKQIITNEVDAPIQIFMADFDNDGDKDILYNSQQVVDPDYLAWRANDGLGNFGVEQVITTNVVAPRGLFAADIDNDGDMDVLSSSIADHKLAWYENYTILGVEETLALKIKIHPNPANTVLYISNSSNYTISSLQITDVQGKLVKQVPKNTNQLDISNLATGVYFVNMITNKGSLVKKIIKE